MSLIVTTPEEAVKYALEIGYCPELKIIRDKEGQWAHPVINAYIDKYYNEKSNTTPSERDFLLRSHFGISVKRLLLEDDSSLSNDEKEKCHADLSNWQPEPPKGYFLASIMHWEAGETANFIKYNDVVTPYDDLRLVEMFEERLSHDLNKPLADLKTEFRNNRILLGRRYGKDKQLLLQFNDFRKSFFTALDALGFKEALEQYVDDYLNSNLKDTFSED